MQSSDSKNYFYIIGIIAICIILYATRQILAPFVIAFMIAYALDPLVDKLEEWKLPRTMAIVFFLLLIQFGLRNSLDKKLLLHPHCLKGTQVPLPCICNLHLLVRL